MMYKIITRIVCLTVFTLFAFCVYALPGYAQTFCSTDVPLRIPPSGSEGTTFSTLDVPLRKPVLNVVVKLYINHTFQGDLETTLISPLNTEVLLFADVDGTNDNFGTSCGDNDMNPNFVLDDDAATPVGDIDMFDPVGSFIPEEPLSTFNTELPTGTWTLQILDDSSGDIGDLNCWCLEITVEPENIPTLSEWGLIAMAGILGIVGFIAIRRRKVTA